MEIIYAGTDSELVELLADRLSIEGIDHERLIFRPDSESERDVSFYVVRTDDGSWARAARILVLVTNGVAEARTSSVKAAYEFATKQANRRGRLELAAILFLLFGVLAGFLSYPHVFKPDPCPWVPPVPLSQ